MIEVNEKVEIVVIGKFDKLSDVGTGRHRTYFEIVGNRVGQTCGVVTILQVGDVTRRAGERVLNVFNEWLEILHSGSGLWLVNGVLAMNRVGLKINVGSVKCCVACCTNEGNVSGCHENESCENVFAFHNNIMC